MCGAGPLGAAGRYSDLWDYDFLAIIPQVFYYFKGVKNNVKA